MIGYNDPVCAGHSGAWVCNRPRTAAQYRATGRVRGRMKGNSRMVQTGWKPLQRQAAKFEAGEIVVTPAARAALVASGQSLEEILARHRAGDWGEVPEHVRDVNERGLLDGFNLQSTYSVNEVERLVVVTQRDRTVTMIHLDRSC